MTVVGVLQLSLGILKLSLRGNQQLPQLFGGVHSGASPLLGV